MTLKLKAFNQLLLISLSSALLLACANQHNDELNSTTDNASTYTQGIPGSIHSNVTSIEAQVSSIDYKKHRVTLKDSQGNQRSLQISPEAINFEQVKVGDQVTVTVAEEMAIFMRDKNAPAVKDTATGIIASAAKGEKPSLLVADSREVSAVISAVDIAQHTATLTLADGSSKTVAVRPDVKITKDAIGHQMVIRITTAMAVAVTPK